MLPALFPFLVLGGIWLLLTIAQYSGGPPPPRSLVLGVWLPATCCLALIIGGATVSAVARYNADCEHTEPIIPELPVLSGLLHPCNPLDFVGQITALTGATPPVFLFQSLPETLWTKVIYPFGIWIRDTIIRLWRSAIDFLYYYVTVVPEILAEIQRFCNYWLQTMLVTIINPLIKCVVAAAQAGWDMACALALKLATIGTSVALAVVETIGKVIEMALAIIVQCAIVVRSFFFLYA
jgi:hypothetical protein